MQVHIRFYAKVKILVYQSSQVYPLIGTSAD